MESTAIDDRLFVELDPPLLAGSSCGDCDVVVFPAAHRCPGCTGEYVTRIALPNRGTIWTWTTQAFAPKPPYQPPPSGFEPFVVGYVDLGTVLVESRIIGEVAIGDEVELRVLDLGGGDVTFAFTTVAS
ncbi:Zn-ribbon domain-containing OB-fold protein [Rhodococcus sp. 14-1411-2a]|uniref:Zn-ribbon domain-containing OB-fold protein n=1 Tax=Rhodococcus sp. 14-1411-2a TaxID=2023151 RepID=UPI000B9AB71A|nr:OB-fold domain-containing protein [Rhodococcus sp. 14-1411-2a]OZF53231.1 hypothetical protein CH291_01370 [Rhodococcus sp. 14-1411-2a]